MDLQLLQINLLHAVIELENQQANIVAIHDLARRMRRRRRRQRRCWVRPWLTRRNQLGQYDQLMTELEREDPAAYRNFIRMDRELFRELVERVSPRITRIDNNYRTPLEPALMVAITLRYLATGASYHTLMYSFRVAHNTISIVIRQVCQAIIDEYQDEVIVTPHTPEGWKELADLYSTRWNFHNTIGSIDGKHIAIRKPTCFTLLQLQEIPLHSDASSRGR